MCTVLCSLLMYHTIIQWAVLPAGPLGHQVPYSTLHRQPLSLDDYFLSVALLQDV